MSSSSASRGVTSRILHSTASAAVASNNGQRSALLPKAVPSLQEFMHKQKVLHLYRSFLRAIRLIEDETERQSAFEQVHGDFKKHATLLGLAKQMAVTDGERRLKQVQSMVGYSATSLDGQQHEGDSWLSTQDPDDPRGRVGVGWPWDRADEN